MIFFDLEALINKHVQGKFTERDGFNYLLGFFFLAAFNRILTGTTSTSQSHNYGSPGLLVYVIVVPVILLIIWAILNWLYERNGGDVGRDFLARLLSVQFVVGMRVLIPLILLLFFARLSGSPILLIFAGFFAIASVVYILLTVANALERIARLDIHPSGQTAAATIPSGFIINAPSNGKILKSPVAFADELQKRFGERCVRILQIKREIRNLNLSKVERIKELEQRLTAEGFQLTSDELNVIDSFES